MTYDQKICDEYVSNLENVIRCKSALKDCKRRLDNMNEIVQWLSTGSRGNKASLVVQRELTREYNATNQWLIYWTKQSEKSTKKYKQYCAKKEST